MVGCFIAKWLVFASYKGFHHMMGFFLLVGTLDLLVRMRSVIPRVLGPATVSLSVDSGTKLIGLSLGLNRGLLLLSEQRAQSAYKNESSTTEPPLSNL